jgi:hypothetical protein
MTIRRANSNLRRFRFIFCRTAPEQKNSASDFGFWKLFKRRY